MLRVQALLGRQKGGTQPQGEHVCLALLLLGDACAAGLKVAMTPSTCNAGLGVMAKVACLMLGKQALQARELLLTLTWRQGQGECGMPRGASVANWASCA